LGPFCVYWLLCRTREGHEFSSSSANWCFHGLQHSICHIIYNVVQRGNINFHVCDFQITTIINTLRCIIVAIGSLTNVWRCSSSTFCFAMMRFLSLVSLRRLLTSHVSASIRSSCSLECVLQAATILDAQLTFFQRRGDTIACRNWQLRSS
jgi:hypothetical protein